MGNAAYEAEECGEAIEYAYSITTRARVKSRRGIGVPANMKLTPIIVIVTPLT